MKIVALFIFRRGFTQRTRGLGAGSATRVALLGSRHHAHNATNHPKETKGKNNDDDKMLHAMND